MARFTCSFISYALMRSVEITVLIPTPTYPDMLGRGEFPAGEARHTPREKYPVLYLLHGVGNDHRAWTAYTNVELYAEENNIAVVMFSAENKCYADQPGGDNFFRFLQEELPDFVCGMFPISHRMEDSYIAGLSMGGYGTLLHAFSAPERYMAAGAFSAAIHIDPLHFRRAAGSAQRAEAFDPLALIHTAIESKKHVPKLYVACGEEDFLFSENVAFRDQLQELGADFTWDQEPGLGHEWRFWNSQIEKFLHWLPRTDFYAKRQRKC